MGRIQSTLRLLILAGIGIAGRSLALAAPTGADTKMTQASVALESNNIQKAEKLLRNALGKRSESAEAHLELAAVLASAGNLGEARTLATRAEELFRSQQKHGDAKALGEILVDAAQFKFRLADFLSQKGFSIHDAGNESEAELLFRLCLLLEPNLASGQVGLAGIFYDTARFERAERALRSAIVIDPEYASAYSGLGNVLLVRDRYVDAEKECRKAIQLQNDLVDGWVCLLSCSGKAPT